MRQKNPQTPVVARVCGFLRMVNEFSFSIVLWQRAVILIENGDCGVQRRKSWGASHRVVGCIFCFGVHFGVQIPGVVTAKRCSDDRTDEVSCEIE